MDISLEDMKEMFRLLSVGLQTTKGDKATLSKLEEIRVILDKTHIDSSKIDSRANASAIGRAVADAIASKIGSSLNSTSPAATGVGGVNSTNETRNFISAQRDAISELNNFTNSLRSSRNLMNNPNTSGVGGSGLNNTSNSTPPSRLHRSNLTRERISESVISEFSTGLKALYKQMQSSVDAYRSMQNMGLSSIDAAGKGSILELRNIANQAGLPVATFTKALETGSSGLRQLGLTSVAGLSLALRNASRDSANFGLTIDGTLSAMNDYVEMQKYTRGLDSVNEESTIRGFKEMMNSTTGLAAALGTSRDQIQKGSVELAKNPQYQALLTAYNPEARTTLTNVQAGLSDQSKGFNLAATAGAKGVYTEDQAAYATAFPQAYREHIEALRALDAGAINEQQFTERLSRVGKLMEQESAARGNIAGYANAANNSAVLRTEQTGLVAGREFSSIRPSNYTAATTAINNPTEFSKSVLQLNDSAARFEAAVQLAETKLVEVSQNSSTEIFKSFNETAQSANSLANAFNGILDPIHHFDNAISSVLKSIGPQGTFVAAIAGAVGLKIAGLVGTNSSLLRTLGSMARGAARAAPAALEVPAAEGAMGTVIRGAGIGSRIAGGAVLGTLIDAQQNKLNVGEADELRRMHSLNAEQKAELDRQETLAVKAQNEMTNEERNRYKNANDRNKDVILNEVLERLQKVAVTAPVVSTPVVSTPVVSTPVISPPPTVPAPATLPPMPTDLNIKNIIQLPKLPSTTPPTSSPAPTSPPLPATPTLTTPPAPPNIASTSDTNIKPPVNTGLALGTQLLSLATPMQVNKSTPIERGRNIVTFDFNKKMAEELNNTQDISQPQNKSSANSFDQQQNSESVDTEIPRTASISDLLQTQITALAGLTDTMKDHNLTLAEIMTKIETNTADTSRYVSRTPNRIG